MPRVTASDVTIPVHDKPRTVRIETSHGKTRKEFGHGKHGWHGVPNGFSPGIPRSPWPDRFSWRATERHGKSSATESTDGTEYQTGFLRVFRAVRGQIAFRSVNSVLSVAMPDPRDPRPG